MEEKPMIGIQTIIMEIRRTYLITPGKDMLGAD